MTLNCPRCNKDVDEHEAGRCMDAWIAEAVMELPPREHTFRYEEGNTPDGTDGWAGFQCSYCDAAVGSAAPCLLYYSTQIADVWTVVDRLQGEPEQFFFGIRRTPAVDGRWHVEFGALFAADENLCLAICRAALKSVTEWR